MAAANSFRFVAINLREPDKRSLKAGAPVQREADAVLIDRATGAAYEAVVDLDLSVGQQPPVMLDEFAEAEENCKKDPRVVEALAGRGLTDLDLVCIEPWSSGYYRVDAHGRRLLRCLVFVRLDAVDNSSCPRRARRRAPSRARCRTDGGVRPEPSPHGSW